MEHSDQINMMNKADVLLYIFSIGKTNIQHMK